MRLDKKIFYHAGWVVGVAWVLMGFLQAYLGIQFRIQTDSTLAGVYQWLSVSMAVLGIVWLLFWFFCARTFLRSADAY